MKLVLATRRSELALWQAEAARRALLASAPGLEVELLPVASAGDRDTESALARFGRIGIFTVEVDRLVLEGRAHAAVHSLKDMTTELQADLRLAGCLGRGPVEDAWISRDGAPLAELPEGGRVATGSRRRAAMVRALRPDAEIVEVRGNVQTRLRRLAEGAAEAMVLARAGLVRLGLEGRISEVLDRRRFLPACGQGIVGLTCRTDDRDTWRRLVAVTDLEAWHEALAERSLLRALRGGCNVPIGAHARVVEDTLHLEARVLSLDGTERVEGSVTGERDAAAALGRLLAEDLLARGAAELVEASRAAGD